MISSKLFYSKREKLKTCIPSNCVGSDCSSSDSESEIPVPKKNKFCFSKGNVLAASDSESESDLDDTCNSEERWPRGRADIDPDKVVPPSDQSSEISSPQLSQCSQMSLPLKGIETSPETDLKEKYRESKDENGNVITPLKVDKGKPILRSKRITSHNTRPSRLPLSTANTVNKPDAPRALPLCPIGKENAASKSSKGLSAQSSPSKRSLNLLERAKMCSKEMNNNTFGLLSGLPQCSSVLSKIRPRSAAKRVSFPKGSDSDVPQRKQIRSQITSTSVGSTVSSKGPPGSKQSFSSDDAAKRVSLPKGSDSDVPQRKQIQSQITSISVGSTVSSKVPPGSKQSSSSDDEPLSSVRVKMFESGHIQRTSALNCKKPSESLNVGATPSVVSSLVLQDPPSPDHSQNNASDTLSVSKQTNFRVLQKSHQFSPSVTLECGENAKVVTSSPKINQSTTTAVLSPGLSPVPKILTLSEQQDEGRFKGREREETKMSLRPRRTVNNKEISDSETEHWPSPPSSNRSSDGFKALTPSSSSSGSSGVHAQEKIDLPPKSLVPKAKPTTTPDAIPISNRSTAKKLDYNDAHSLSEEEVDNPDIVISSPPKPRPKPFCCPKAVVKKSARSSIPIMKKGQQRKQPARQVDNSVSCPNSVLIDIEKPRSSAKTARNQKPVAKGKLNAMKVCVQMLPKKNGNDTSEGGWVKEDIEAPWHSDHVLFTIPEVIKEPIEYFRYYFDSEVMDLIVQQTNLYIHQDRGEAWSVTENDINVFLGIQVYMGICSLPGIRDYWASCTLVKQVADLMPRNKFQKIRSHLHFNDNASVDPDETDRMVKIRPLIKIFRTKCQLLEEEAEQCVDECMVGYKGKRAASIRQYMPDKPSHKWGFKIFSRNGKSGLMYDFIPYYGANTFESEHLTREEIAIGAGGQAVISLCKSIKHPSSTTVTFDNYYTGLPLLKYLKEDMNIVSLGTIKANRTGKCPLMSDDELEKQGRGSYDYRKKEDVFVVKWADNKCVCLASTKVGLNPMGTIPRYDADAHQKIPVPCPQIVLEYNSTMGGTDLFDQYMALYRTPSRARRWYFPLFGFLLELALINSFLLYKRESELIDAKLEYPTLKDFRLKVFSGLTAVALAGQGRPTLDRALLKKATKRRLPQHGASDDLRRDNIGHLIGRTPKRGRCAYCATGHTSSICSKCNKRLCVTETRNCFAQFHIVKVLPERKPKN
ncbi:hypothetical protein FOCC_FOCC011148 [Frankliniella occidentalis]|nr:hypothetical protein FOCC_FOCC011148 [Frankliniella occidentalis]